MITKPGFYSITQLMRQDWFPFTSKLTVYKLIEIGKIKAINVGTGKVNRFLIEDTEIQRFMGSLAVKQ